MIKWVSGCRVGWVAGYFDGLSAKRILGLYSEIVSLRSVKDVFRGGCVQRRVC